MSSVQDHSTIIKDLSERQQQDPQATQSQVPPRVAGDLSDPYREPTPEAPTHSPPRFSQLLNPLPEGSEPNPPRRGLSAGTNSVTLVNHPGTIGGPINDTTMQSGSMTPNQPAPAPDRRLPIDPIRGDIPVHQASDDGDHGRGSSIRRVPVPRPRAIFNPAQDGNGNGSRAALRASSGTDLYTPQPPQQPQLSRTVEERLRPTLEAATKERNKYKKQARIQGLLINGAIGLQVVVGAITTGVAAGSKNIGAAVAVLGGISTTLASYLAKARGSGEPEFSHLRSRELSTFIREVEAFILDKGLKVGPEFDVQISIYRERFELIIKTEGEDSTAGTGYASHSRTHHPVPNQQQMGGVYAGGGQYQGMPPQQSGGYGQLSEKQQMWKNEKALSGMV